MVGPKPNTVHGAANWRRHIRIWNDDNLCAPRFLYAIHKGFPH